ncbi:TraM recognition domain-containing protein [Acetobacter pasteurianus]|uniref:TraM recognition domain-containing protein n=1 Tax=Acetobacter pasteurianus TaxID=438 RepID=UPI001363D0C7|nr:TraM recognition domain-containing protein [Acetobacter pasteurianus]QHM90388.1 TraM recognition domain-containing protein [Acetobacter pasteurianus]
MAVKTKQIRGAVEGQEVFPDLTTIDIRTKTQKRRDWFKDISNLLMLQMASLVMLFVVPQVGIPCILFSLAIYSISSGKPSALPLKKPVQSKEIDPNEAIGGKARPAAGIFYLGNDMATGEEVWLSNSDARQHFTVIGTTGAGKTETLIGYGANALSWGSGFIYVDGKGDVSLFAKVFVMLRKLGLEDNLLIMNFMNAALPGMTGYRKKSSNTTNPFASGSSADLTQMVASLMDEAGGDSATWKSRAIDMLTGEMDALCWLRDRGIIELDAGVISDFMTLEKLMELAKPENYPDMPPKTRKGVQTYLNSIGVNMEKKASEQDKTPRDQHTYLLMQFQKVLGTLVKVYGYIFETQFGEVDMYDVILNRRVLIVMLPALGKAMDEIIALGKIVVATLKGMMAATLGSMVEGTWDQVVENRVTTSNSPVVVVFDEVGYYLVPGMDLIAAQARGCGFCLIYASQDVDSMGRIDQKIANSVIGNTSTKFFMKIEDANSTADLAIKRGGKITRARAQSFDRRDPSNDQFYMGDSSSYEEISRVDMIDLVSQGAGEGHLTHLGKLIRMQAFYAAPERTVDLKKIKLSANYFIPVPRPSPADLQIDIRHPQILAMLVDDGQIEKMKNAVKAAENRLNNYREADSLHDSGEDEGQEFTRDEILDLACAINPEGGTNKPLIEVACSAIAYIRMRKEEALGLTPAESDDYESNNAGWGSTANGRSFAGLPDRMESRGYNDMPPARAGKRNPLDGIGLSSAGEEFRRKAALGNWGDVADDDAEDNTTPHKATVDDKEIPFDDGSKLSANPIILDGLAAANRVEEHHDDEVNTARDSETEAAEGTSEIEQTEEALSGSETVSGNEVQEEESTAKSSEDGGASFLDNIFSTEGVNPDEEGEEGNDHIASTENENPVEDAHNPDSDDQQTDGLPPTNTTEGAPLSDTQAEQSEKEQSTQVAEHSTSEQLHTPIDTSETPVETSAPPQQPIQRKTVQSEQPTSGKDDRDANGNIIIRDAAGIHADLFGGDDDEEE